MCPYKHCIQQDWSLWNVFNAASNVCPNEERFRRWTEKTMFKGAHANCNGIGIANCQTAKREERKKGNFRITMKCSSVKSPMGGYLIGPLIPDSRPHF